MAFISESIVDIVVEAHEEMFLYLLVAIIALWSVLNFKNRNFQIILNTINIILNALLIGVSAYYLLNLPGGDSTPEKGIWLIVPLLNIVLLVLANRYIRKDIALVKSVDRIR